MKSAVRFRALLFCLAALLVAPLAGAQSLAGDWAGALDAGGAQLRVLFHLAEQPNGALGGTVDSLDQGAFGVPLSAVTVEGARVRFAVPSIGGSYEGTLDEARTTIDGRWTQGGILPLKLTRQPAGATRPAAAPVRRRPQTPVPPFPYREEQITYPNQEAGITLGATITIPPGRGPFPAVLLITGSGAQDRNEALLGHQPFLVLADALARRGILVLRADDRGIGASTGSFAEATTTDFVSDARAGVAYLRSRSEVDRRHIGLIGHSEGGLIAPFIASQDPAVAFVVMIAGPTVAAAEILIGQATVLARSQGANDEAIARITAQSRQVYSLIKTETDGNVLKDKLRALAGNAPKEQVEAQLASVTSPWFVTFLRWDPQPPLRNLKTPVLAIYGGKDMQVPAAQNAGPARTLLASNPKAEVVEFPGLNHLMQNATTGLPSEYGTIEETMAPAVLDKIGTWIQSAVE